MEPDQDGRAIAIARKAKAREAAQEKRRERVLAVIKPRPAPTAKALDLSTRLIDAIGIDRVAECYEAFAKRVHGKVMKENGLDDEETRNELFYLNERMVHKLIPNVSVSASKSESHSTETIVIRAETVKETNADLLEELILHAEVEEQTKKAVAELERPTTDT